jgi:hypothetical protein
MPPKAMPSGTDVLVKTNAMRTESRKLETTVAPLARLRR